MRNDHHHDILTISMWREWWLRTRDSLGFQSGLHQISYLTSLSVSFFTCNSTVIMEHSLYATHAATYLPYGVIWFSRRNGCTEEICLPLTHVNYSALALITLIIIFISTMPIYKCDTWRKAWCNHKLMADVISLVKKEPFLGVCFRVPSPSTKLKMGGYLAPIHTVRLISNRRTYDIHKTAWRTTYLKYIYFF